MAILRSSAAVLIALATASETPTHGAGPETREYDLKAAFLFNFAQFVEWPDSAFPEAGTPISICILGEDPLGKSLDTILEGEKVRDRSLVAQRYRTIEQVDRCHMLFIGASEEARLDAILTRLRGRSILTIGETEAFSAHAGMIRFALVDNRVRLRINLEAARAAGLTISSKLLRLAEIESSGGTP